MASLPTPFKLPRVWSSDEVGCLLKCSRRTVVRLVATGKLRAQRQIGWERGPDGKGRKIVRYRISSKALEDYHAANEAQSDRERVQRLRDRHAACPMCHRPWDRPETTTTAQPSEMGPASPWGE